MPYSYSVNISISTPPAQSFGYDVFVLGGQSNAYFGTTTEAQDVYPDRVMQIGHYLDDDGEIIPAQEPLDHYNQRSNNAAGPLRTFIDDYISNGHLASGRQILLVGGALNGTGFDDNRWNKGDDLYENLVSRVQQALGYPGSQLKGIFMQMGERDSEGTDDEWEARSIAFSVNFKKDIGLNYSSTPYVFGGMLPSWVAATQARVDVDTRMKIIDTYIEYSGYASPNTPTELTEHVGDGLHYNVVSQRELGHRYYTAWVAAQGNSFARDVSDAVDDLAVTPQADYDMQLNWTKPAGAYPYIDSYNVYYKLPASGTWTLFENTTGLQSTITGLSATTEYDFMVRAVNFEGESPNSNIVTDTTELSPITYTHAFRFEFDNNLSDGIGGTASSWGTINYTNDGTRGNVYGQGEADTGVITGVSIPADSDWTKCAWINMDSATVQHFMSSGDASGTSLMVQSSKVRVGTLASAYAISQSDTLASGWNHVMVTYNATTDHTELFINNVSKGTATITDQGTHQIYLGRNTQTAGFQGLLDDARLYLRELTPAERAQVYAGDEI